MPACVTPMASRSRTIRPKWVIPTCLVIGQTITPRWAPHSCSRVNGSCLTATTTTWTMSMSRARRDGAIATTKEADAPGSLIGKTVFMGAMNYSFLEGHARTYESGIFN